MLKYEAQYSMGGIATGGYFKSEVVANKAANVKGLLTETHGEEITNLYIEIVERSSNYKRERVISTINA